MKIDSLDLHFSQPKPVTHWLLGVIPITRSQPYTKLPSSIPGEPPLYVTGEDKLHLDAVICKDPTFEHAYQRVQQDYFDWVFKRNLYEGRGIDILPKQKKWLFW